MSKQEIMSVPVLYQAIANHQDHKKLIDFLVDLLGYIVDTTANFLPCYWDHKMALQLFDHNISPEERKRSINDLLTPTPTTVGEAILFLANNGLDKMGQKDLVTAVFSKAVEHFTIFYPQRLLIEHLKRKLSHTQIQCSSQGDI